jgi:hypothetical protein
MVTYSTQDTVGGDLPLPLGGGQVAAPGTIGAVTSNFDVFVDDLSMNLHITRDTPYQRQTADAMKQQFDLAPEAGEHSLSTWWIRSQMSFHGGAGIKYLDSSHNDTSDQTTVRTRYDDSRGVDVWTRGEIKRLPDTTLLAPTSGQTWCFSATVGGETYLLHAYGTTFRAIRTNANDTINYTVTGLTAAIKSLAIDGSRYFIASADGSIFSGPIDNSTAGTVAWSIPANASVTLAWCKERLMAGIDNKVYELAGTGPTLPTPLYTHPSSDWKWVAFAEGPAAIFGAGRNGMQSTIYSFTISDPLGVPQLMPGVSIAALPTGEWINCLYSYVGSYFAIGTNLGLRIGNYDSFYGTFKYGPLSFPSRIEDAVAVTSLHGKGSFIYAGTVWGGESHLVRLDLGTLTDQGVFAWAPDQRAPIAGQTGTVDAIAVDPNGRLRFNIRGYGLVAEGTTYVSTRPAYLRTARVRYDTVDNKHFKYGQLRSEGSGTVSVSAQSEQTAMRLVYSVATGGTSQRFSVLGSTGEWVQLQFDLTGQGKLTSYQILAVPAAVRSRLFSIPVQVFDHERNRHNQPIGYPGRAKDILSALESIEANGDEITVQCPVLGIDSVRCTVERIEFSQPSNPAAGKTLDLGGYANLIFRTTT